MSHILYLIQLYGGCSNELITALQVQQNRAARMVCKKPWKTSTKDLLQQIGWLNIKQMVVYYSILNLFQAKQHSVPKYIHAMISEPFKMKTRTALNGGLKENRRFKTLIGQSSFITRTINQWNDLPTEIKMENTYSTFSSKLREWVKTNID